jgi:hypothetical protein
MDISTGHCRCHTALDICLDPTGDISLITGQEEINQRFFLYLAIPKGEFYLPDVGCYAYDFLHEKVTSNNLRRMEQDLLADMEYQFPELAIQSVTCQKDLSDPFQVRIMLRLSNEELIYLYSQEELMTLVSLLSNIVESSY